MQITERAVQRIVHDLVDEGYVAVEKHGRRNHYVPDLDAHLRHPLEAGATIRDFFELRRCTAGSAPEAEVDQVA